MQSLPPRHYPKDLSKRFAADPFDKRMRLASPAGGLTHTSLGLLVEIWEWVRQNPQAVPPALVPVIESITTHLRREAPDALEFLEQMQ